MKRRGTWTYHEQRPRSKTLVMVRSIREGPAPSVGKNTAESVCEFMYLGSQIICFGLGIPEGCTLEGCTLEGLIKSDPEGSLLMSPSNWFWWSTLGALAMDPLGRVWRKTKLVSNYKASSLHVSMTIIGWNISKKVNCHTNCQCPCTAPRHRPCSRPRYRVVQRKVSPYGFC